MAIINAINLKSDLHNMIDKVNDTALLNAIKTILSAQLKENDFWKELPLNVQKSVKRGMEQAQSGKTKAHPEVIKNYKKQSALRCKSTRWDYRTLLLLGQSKRPKRTTLLT